MTQIIKYKIWPNYPSNFDGMQFKMRQNVKEQIIQYKFWPNYPSNFDRIQRRFFLCENKLFHRKSPFARKRKTSIFTHHFESIFRFVRWFQFSPEALKIGIRRIWNESPGSLHTHKIPPYSSANNLRLLSFFCISTGQRFDPHKIIICSQARCSGIQTDANLEQAKQTSHLDRMNDFSRSVIPPIVFLNKEGKK